MTELILLFQVDLNQGYVRYHLQSLAICMHFLLRETMNLKKHSRPFDKERDGFVMGR